LNCSPCNEGQRCPARADQQTTVAPHGKRVCVMRWGFCPGSAPACPFMYMADIPRTAVETAPPSVAEIVLALRRRRLGLGGTRRRRYFFHTQCQHCDLNR
jgi:hypothetical protein